MAKDGKSTMEISVAFSELRDLKSLETDVKITLALERLLFSLVGLGRF